MPWAVPFCITPLALLAGYAAVARDGFCLKDANGDGQPIFGNPCVRTGFENTDAKDQAWLLGRATSVAFGDVDGDGAVDAVVVNPDPHPDHPADYLTILRGRGDGVFDPPMGSLPSGKEGTDVLVADFDDDGDLDIAVANALSNNVGVYVNQGAGAFKPPVKYGVGVQPRSIKAVDVDGDGWIDIVALNTLSSSVSLLRNLGGGVFAPKKDFFVADVTKKDDGSAWPYPGPFMDAADVNGDGRIDLAIPAGKRVRFLLGDGAGGFSLVPLAQSPLATGIVYAVALGDMDGDADMDVVCTRLPTTGPLQEGLNLFFNQADGTDPVLLKFGPVVPYLVGWGVGYAPPGLSLADLEGDGDLDVAWSTDSLTLHPRIFRNDGNGTLGMEDVPVTQISWFVRFADVNADGFPDLTALSTFGRSTLRVQLNDGRGNILSYDYFPKQAEPCCGNWNALAAGDLDLDGDLDLVAGLTSSEFEDQLRVLLNDGRADFSEIRQLSLGPAGTVSIGNAVLVDLDQDSFVDLVLADTVVPGGFDKPGAVWVLRGLGNGEFGVPEKYGVGEAFPVNLVTADLDRDGDLDIVTLSIELYPGNDLTPALRRLDVFQNQDGRFALQASYPFASLPWMPWGAFTVVDADGDGNLDVVAGAGPKFAPGIITLFRNDGKGVLIREWTLSAPPHPSSLAATDLDHNGHADLILLADHNMTGAAAYPYAMIYWNNGRGEFPQETAFTDPRIMTQRNVAVADFLNRGRPDLVMCGVANCLIIHMHDGAAGFQPPVSYGNRSLTQTVVPGDFDGDGRVDVAATYMIGFHGVAIFRNLSCPTSLDPAHK